MFTRLFFELLLHILEKKENFTYFLHQKDKNLKWRFVSSSGKGDAMRECLKDCSIFTLQNYNAERTQHFCYTML